MNFSLRIVNADFYSTAPLAGLDDVFSEFRGSKIAQVPVIRIFGSTPNGQKTCLHVHGVFPYIYLPFKGDEPRDVYLKQFATSIDFAVHVSQGKASSSTHHVHNIEIVTARSFYGYHEAEKEFMKISFYNPFIVSRVVELLQNGAVMNTRFQPYEAHIPYIQQMFIDYNLYGMNMLNASSVLFRTPIQLKQDRTVVHESSFHSPKSPVLTPSSTTGSPMEVLWNEQTVPRRWRHSLEVERLSVSELEVDVRAESIMNQYEIGTSIGSNPGLVAIWHDERQRRQDENDDSDISPPISQDRGDIVLLEAERKFKERLHQIIEERNVLLQSQILQQESSPSQPNENQSLSSSYDENTPIIDRSVVEEVVRSSQRSLSQKTVDVNDMEMIEILASLADSQSQSQRNTQPADIDEDENVDEEAQEDQDSITMSQQVWDDTDPSDYITTEDDRPRDDNSPDHQGSQLRLSQFDFEGLDDTWEVSLLSENPIPQLDGVNDLDSPPMNAKTLQRKRVARKPTHSTRSRRLSTDRQDSKSSSKNLDEKGVRSNDKNQRSLGFVGNQKQSSENTWQASTSSKELGLVDKRKPTRRLGMSSVRVTSSQRKTNDSSQISVTIEKETTENSNSTPDDETPRSETNKNLVGHNKFKKDSVSFANKRKETTKEGTTTASTNSESILKDFDSIFEVEVSQITSHENKPEQHINKASNSITRIEGSKDCTIQPHQRNLGRTYAAKRPVSLTKDDSLAKDSTDSHQKTTQNSFSENSNFEETPMEIDKTNSTKRTLSKTNRINTRKSEDTITSSKRAQLKQSPSNCKKRNDSPNSEFSLRLSDSDSSYAESNKSKSDESFCQDDKVRQKPKNENIHIKHIEDFEIPQVTVEESERTNNTELSPGSDVRASLIRNKEEAKNAARMEVDEIDVSFLQEVQQEKIKSESTEDMYDNIKRRVFANYIKKSQSKVNESSSPRITVKSKDFSNKNSLKGLSSNKSSQRQVLPNIEELPGRKSLQTSSLKMSKSQVLSHSEESHSKEHKEPDFEVNCLDLSSSPVDKLNPQKFSRNCKRRTLTLSRSSKKRSQLKNDSKSKELKGTQNVEQSRENKVPIAIKPTNLQSSDELPSSIPEDQIIFPELQSQDQANPQVFYKGQDSQAKGLKVVLTDIAYDQSQSHLFAAALDRWKRQNEKQAKVKKLYSPPKSSFGNVFKDSSGRNKSPRKSPKGKRYGILDITIQTSPSKLTPSVSTRAAFSSLKSARSLSFHSSQNDNNEISNKSVAYPVCERPPSPSKIVRNSLSNSIEFSESKPFGSANRSELPTFTTLGTTQSKSKSSPTRSLGVSSISKSKVTGIGTGQTHSNRRKSGESSPSKALKYTSVKPPNSSPNSSFRRSKSIDASPPLRSSQISLKLERSRSLESSPSKSPTTRKMGHSPRSKSIDSAQKKSSPRLSRPSSSQPTSPMFKKGRASSSPGSKHDKIKKTSPSQTFSAGSKPDDINHLLDVLGSCFSKTSDFEEHTHSWQLKRKETALPEVMDARSNVDANKINQRSAEKALYTMSTSFPKVENHDEKLCLKSAVCNTRNIPGSIPVSINETKAPHNIKKRKKSEQDETSRKHRRLSLKLKSKSNNSSNVEDYSHSSEDDREIKLSDNDQVRKRQRETQYFESANPDNTDDSAELVDKVNDSFEDNDNKLFSSGEDDLDNKSPSILEETVFDHSTCGTTISAADRESKIENKITTEKAVTHSFTKSKSLEVSIRKSTCVTEAKDVTQSLTRPTSSETYDSSETLDLDSPPEEIHAALTTNSDDPIKSDDGEEAHESFLNSSPDLFDSALFNMSYPSPNNKEDVQASPPIPSTPSKTSNDKVSLIDKEEISNQGNDCANQPRNITKKTSNVSAEEPMKTSKRINGMSGNKKECQATLKEHVKVPWQDNHTPEDQRTIATLALCALSAENFSENNSESTEHSLDSGKLSLGVSQVEPGLGNQFSIIDKEQQKSERIHKTLNNFASLKVLQNKLQSSKEQRVTFENTPEERTNAKRSGTADSLFFIKANCYKDKKGDEGDGSSTCTGKTVDRTCTTASSVEKHNIIDVEMPRYPSRTTTQNSRELSGNVNETVKSTHAREGVDESFEFETNKENNASVQHSFSSQSTRSTVVNDSTTLQSNEGNHESESIKGNQEDMTESSLFDKGLAKVDDVCTSEDSLDIRTSNGLRPTDLQVQELSSQKTENVSALNVLRKYCLRLELEKQALLGHDPDSPYNETIPDNYYFIRGANGSSNSTSTSQGHDLCSTRLSEVSPSCSNSSTDSNRSVRNDERVATSQDNCSYVFEENSNSRRCNNGINKDNSVSNDHDTLLGSISTSTNTVKRSLDETSKSVISSADGIKATSQKNLTSSYGYEEQQLQNITHSQDERSSDNKSSGSLECSQRETSHTLEFESSNCNNAVEEEREVDMSSEGDWVSSAENEQTSSNKISHLRKEKSIQYRDNFDCSQGDGVQKSQGYSQCSIYPEDEAYDIKMTPENLSPLTNEQEETCLNNAPVEKENNSGMASSDSLECSQREHYNNEIDVSGKIQLSFEEVHLLSPKESNHDSDSSSYESQSQYQSARSLLDCKETEPDMIIMPHKAAPTTTELLASMKHFGMPQCRYQVPFYSDPKDVPETTMDVGGRLLKIQTNQVKDLADFETRSPFIGLQEWRQLLTANHETSFLDAFKENIGNTETFLSGIETNNEMKIAFMGDKTLDIIPCKPPPHPQTVRLWAEGKLAKKRDALQTKGKTSEPNKGNLKSTIDDKVQKSDGKETNLDKNIAKHPCDSKPRDNKDICVSQNPTRATHEGFDSSDKSMKRAARPPNTVGVTSPNTLFSPLEDAQVSTFANVDHDKQDTVTKQNRPCELNLPLQSTPIPQSRLSHNRVTSPGLGTPAIKAGLPHMPLLTPITATQGLTGEKKSSVVSSPSNAARSSQDTPRRQLMLSQLKLCTPEMALRRRVSDVGSEIEGPSPINTAGYKVPQLNIQDAKASHEVQHLTLLSVELHVRTRKDKRPDPEFDPICALFYHVQTDSQSPSDKTTGIICVDKDSAELPNTTDNSKEDSRMEGNTSANTSACVDRRPRRALLERSGITKYHVQYVKEEQDLFRTFLFLIRQWDPDVLIGYELQMLSWGYLIQRALVFDLDLGKLLSRVTGSSSDSNVDAEKDQWGAAHSHELKIGGRIILNVWRLMRHEVALNIYSFENIAFHLLRERIPLYTFRSLSDWWDHKTDVHRWRTVEHYVTRCHGNVRLLEQVDFIGRTSELARLFGILFFAVISRGSQFRVESMMLRISKPLKYVAISPSVQQRNSMNAPEVIPLVLEPESRFYTNPVLVLDFQSLYPSMVIAYNYCYSTCLGRVSCLEDVGEFKFGASTLSVPPVLLKKLEDDIHISPNGVAFVKQHVRLGVLPKMLEDILNTRIMVKNSMKKWKSKKSVYRMLDARQLGLKLIANVTYGYTAAHFSGRMPCVEVGDSIVRKARETLEHAIHVVNTTSKWAAKVVYGDTDSMFVLLNGASKDEAFRIGREIAETITGMNPKPVKLKFEKVYLPCVLQTKKRYVGYMYETPDQKEPVFDAKGIETVRRDSCPAVAKVLEKSLRILFETKDVSLIKKYVQRQFTKVMEGRVSLQDLTFAKEYRGMKSYKPGACVPALELTRQILKEDRRSEPRVGERVPYVIVYGSPGLPLIKLVRRPMEVLQDPSLRINSLYYITKQLIPPLNRALSLIGVDVNAWFADVPRTSRVRVQPFNNSADTRKKTISHYFTTTNCPVCQQTTTTGLCTSCIDNPLKAVVTLNNKIRQYERKHRQLAEICYQCCGSRDTKLCCVSLDCPVFHKLVKATRDLEPSNHYRQLLDNIFT